MKCTCYECLEEYENHINHLTSLCPRCYGSKNMIEPVTIETMRRLKGGDRIEAMALYRKFQARCRLSERKEYKRDYNRYSNFKHKKKRAKKKITPISNK